MGKQKNKEKIPDMRSMEKTLSGISRMVGEQRFKSEADLDRYLCKVAENKKLKKIAPKNALDVAQDVMYQAWEEEDLVKAVHLAHRALAISQDCADAYNLLADEVADTVEDTLYFYQKGVEAGERALGKKCFKEDAGHFWGLIETRPYMRSKAGLAECLWEMERHNEAIGHYYGMLYLNASDNQGIRYILLGCLGELGRFDEMDKFMRDEYPDDCAPEWLYAKALLAFVKSGPNPTSSANLREAWKQNKFVPDYLLGKKKIPRVFPDRIMMGGEDEGYCCAAKFLAAWKRVPGALDWLRAEAQKFIPPKTGRNESCHCGSGKKFKKCCGVSADIP
ncbi:SEC-C metal-binding domain-containing protein [Elusimicrobiota bacterium]